MRLTAGCSRRASGSGGFRDRIRDRGIGGRGRGTKSSATERMRSQSSKAMKMGRPGLIELSMSIARGKLVAAAIPGDAVRVAEGTIEA